MKTILFILAFMGIALSKAQVSVDGTPIVNPPGPVLDKFYKEHTGISNPRWEDDGTYYSAEYTDPTSKTGRRVVYDTQGNHVCNETEIPPKYYPQAISTYCKKKFPGKESKVWTCKESNGKRTYFTRYDNTLIWFDKNGKFVESTPVKHPEKELITIK